MTIGRVPVASRLLILCGLAFVLAGCDSIREAAGITKEPPDEFAVVTKAPLVIPPDFNLRPPKPGASPTNQQDPTTDAKIALTGTTPGEEAATQTNAFSDAEKALLAKTGAETSDHKVRQQLEAENKRMEASDESFTDKVLFGPQPDQGKPVNADAEAARLSDAKAQGQTMVATPGPASHPADQNKPDDAPQIKKEDSGWLDGILGGIF
ncbi:MAG: DUF3035 domain-containing protein [Rhizomicrobium sp.]|jgi:hypothetical protein